MCDVGLCPFTSDDLSDQKRFCSSEAQAGPTYLKAKSSTTAGNPLRGESTDMMSRGINKAVERVAEGPFVSKRCAEGGC